jgi:NAD+ kinase
LGGGVARVNELVLVYQPYVPATLALARSVAAYLDTRRNSHELQSAHELTDRSHAGVRLAVCFGGDGTALRTARWLSGGEAAVVPVKMGKLSFLGELAAGELPAGLEPYLAGEFWVDERAMLAVSRGDERSTALNDIVLARGESPRAVTVEVLVDGASAVTYLADGVIVSTPTGSTAYSLAAGGPVLAPQLRSLVVTPVAPHLTSLRSLVLPEGATVNLVNRGHVAAVLTVDGQSDAEVEPGGLVEVTMAEQVSRFARRRDRSEFYQGLAAKLRRG